jgi:DNA invertase Pin-like site-specific DNA recombinase
MAAHYINIPKKELRKMFLAGCTYDVLAQRYSCSHCTIYNRLREMRLIQRTHKTKMEKYNLSEIRHLYLDKKLSIGMIADRLRCSQSALRNWMKENGIPLRTPSEGQKLYWIRNGIYKPTRRRRPTRQYS